MRQAEAIVPVHATDRPNDAITLYEGTLEVLGPGSGSVHLEWLPTPRLVFQVEAKTSEPLDATLASSSSIPISLPSIGSSTTGLITGSEVRFAAAEPRRSVRGVANRITVGDAEDLNRLLFHVPNFPSFSGGHVERRRGDELTAWSGRLRAENSAWGVTLDLVENHRDLAGALHNHGGYALTAVGELTRQDGSNFAMADVRMTLDMMSFWLSFIAGQWTQPTLLVGYSRENEQTYQEWEAPRVDRWVARRSIFPEYVLEENRVRATS